MTLTHIIPPESNNRQLKRVIRGAMGVSYRQFSRLKAAGALLVDGCPRHADYRVQTGQTITLTLIDRAGGTETDPAPVTIAYEDADILVIDKDAPLPCQSSEKQTGPTLETRLAHRYGTPYTFRPVNRLDKGTSGLMVVAQHAHAQQLLTKQLHTVMTREYLAITVGCPQPESGLIDAPIGKRDGPTIAREVRADGRPAQTNYQVVERHGPLALVQLRLATGRTHQIRVHMKHLGCPVLGDFLYGAEDPRLPGRFALHSFRLTLTHPTTGQALSFTSPLPALLRGILDPPSAPRPSQG